MNSHPKVYDESQQLQIRCMVRTRIPMEYGNFYVHLYQNNQDNKEHLAIVYGEKIKSKSLNQKWVNDNDYQRLIRGAEDSIVNTPEDLIPLSRIHSECFTGETIGSKRCDCGEQLDLALNLIKQNGDGILLYLRQEGRNIGLLNKLRAYNLQDIGYDTVDANLKLGLPEDGRDYKIAQLIYKDFDINKVQLLTNNPKKVNTIQDLGIKVENRIAMIPKLFSEKETELNSYIRTKVLRMGHMLNI
ncbi:GTP cyclohydrolase II [Neoconidiobolus thromboides FSU 785]|nr:GTP cyclohydrolase II [Neoconidiobolus thromboides FSU 785]